MAGAKSLVLLCFLLAIASNSQAAKHGRPGPPCRSDPCFLRCRLPPLRCAQRCCCDLVDPFLPNELATEVELGRKAKMMEALAATQMEVAHNRVDQAEAELKEMMMMEMMEELISLNHKLTGSCKHNPRYRLCRAAGNSKGVCATRCSCTLVTAELAASTDDEASKATE